MAHEPDDSILLALGRLIWNAINVEDRVYQVAGHVLRRDPPEQVGNCINDAVLFLDRAASDPRVAQALTWFRAARIALDERNEILHAVPSADFVIGPNGVLEPAGSTTLEYLGKKNRIGRAIPLTVDGLTSTTTKLANVLADWQVVTIALFDYVQPNASSLGRRRINLPPGSDWQLNGPL